MKTVPILGVGLTLVSLSLTGCRKHEEKPDLEEHTIVVTSPKVMDVTVTQQYVCQIHSQRHIKVRALQGGYLESIPVKEGQEVKQGDVLFKVIPTFYKAKLDAELAEAKLAELELQNTERLNKQNVVSLNEVALYQAKLAKAKAKAELAKAELNFTEVKAPFDGIIDRQEEQHGSLVKEGDVLTTLSDNSLMWVYFNVPEARYLEYNPRKDKSKSSSKGKDISRLELVDSRIELVLADGSKFNQSASPVLTIEAKFNNETGNGTFRADFPNPDHLLRHGMTGSVLIHKSLKNAVVIPQRATFEILDKRYVFAVGKDDVVKQREIKVRHELEDLFVIQSGIGVDDRFVYEGIRQVRDGDKKEYEALPADQVIAQQKHYAE